LFSNTVHQKEYNLWPVENQTPHKEGGGGGVLM